jgi:hypothetical protein
MKRQMSSGVCATAGDYRGVVSLAVALSDQGLKAYEDFSLFFSCRKAYDEIVTSGLAVRKRQSGIFVKAPGAQSPERVVTEDG